MPRKNKHLKASDVFAKQDTLLGKTSDFSKAFPNIQKVQVVVEEVGEGVSEQTLARHLTEQTLGEYINCRNPRCYKGGVRIGQILRFMEESGETEREQQEYCQGYEGTPKGRKRYGPCENTFHLKISIVFKESP